MGIQSLLKEIFLTQGLNLGLLYCKQILYCLSHQGLGWGSPKCYPASIKKEFKFLKESWVPKIWSFQTVVLEKILESPLDSKKIKPVNPKGNQHWKDWCWSSNTLAIWWEGPNKRPWCWERLKQEENRAKDDEMVGWHHWLNGHELEQSPGYSEEQGSLAYYSPWDCKESDMI